MGLHGWLTGGLGAGVLSLQTAAHSPADLFHIGCQLSPRSGVSWLPCPACALKSSSAAPAGQPGSPLPSLSPPPPQAPRALSSRPCISSCCFSLCFFITVPLACYPLAQGGSFSRNVHFCMKYRPQGGKEWDIDLVPYVDTLEQPLQPPTIHSSQVA